jgi:hypothetical protein
MDDGDVAGVPGGDGDQDEVRKVTERSMMQPGSSFSSYRQAEERPEFSGRRALRMEKSASTRCEEKQAKGVRGCI